MKAAFHIQAKSDSAKARAAISNQLVFGKVFADLMVQIKYNQQQG